MATVKISDLQLATNISDTDYLLLANNNGSYKVSGATLKSFLGSAGGGGGSTGSLASFTWAQIAAVAEMGIASVLWSVGDEKDITLTTGETLTLQIYDFDHDDLTAGGGKAGITFGMKNLTADARVMNSTGTNVGGYTGSELYTWLTDTLYPTLPADLRAVIKSVNKKTSAGDQSTTINTNSMSIFLFSEVECFGTTTYSVAGEGSQYPIFTDDASRTKYQSNGAGNANLWWERSPYASNSSDFCAIFQPGRAAAFVAVVGCCVCFGFCV